ncbi:NAD(P)-dependent oxidoreductase [Neorhizobium sp. T6_25]|jgi:nucleoside-diphosphate-sugar epimerase|uniref:NAD-dependent epimerase/dehydratase family protein n=1 Tax=Neorhizobium sp. T6_25 TaxID=2093833 RepID=UPI000CF8AD80|nr:NAD-dependent epimerase/dehydratase family protein [Neorhizobium sp. T6_25]
MPDVLKAKPVLVTGATGRIGRIVVADLIERGYAVRATTSKPLAADGGKVDDLLEWRRFDFMTDDDWDGLVKGCCAVLHLAAELGKMERMQRVNVEATRQLAQACEREGITAFCYASTVSVYGSGRKRLIDEASPVLTADRDIPSQYWALDYVRMYGRTKLAGELALRAVARQTRFTIVRPAVVVDINQIIGIRDWNPIKRLLGAHRHAHHVYVRDVSDAMIWLIVRGLAGHGLPGQVEVYNLAEDDCPDPRHIDFMRKAFATSHDRRYRSLPIPAVADWLHDFLRFRTLPLRNPLWRMRFSNQRLKEAGYRFRYGMADAQRLALSTLRKTAGNTEAE